MAMMNRSLSFAFLVCVGAGIGVSPARAADARSHPALANAPRITHAPNGVPGDPVNVAFIGSEEDLHLSLLAAKWAPADPVTLKTSVRIVGDTLFRRAYVDAPVSTLHLWGRKQDFAFERAVGKDPRQRHHVRFWRADKVDLQGRPLWVGAATFDTRVGFKQRTVKLTHHIAPDVDTERDKLIRDVKETGDLVDLFWIDRFHEQVRGKNGGGDPWFTDGHLPVGVISLHNRVTQKP
jgi:LssY C-terminus